MATEERKPTESETHGGVPVEKSRPASEPLAEETGPKIRRGKVDSLDIYEVTEGELEIIERGSPNSTYLNFAIFLLSIAVSFLVTLLTVPELQMEAKSALFVVFVVVTVIGFVVGLVLLALWLRTKNDVDVVLKKIRERVR